MQRWAFKFVCRSRLSSLSVGDRLLSEDTRVVTRDSPGCGERQPDGRRPAGGADGSRGLRDDNSE